MTRSDRRTGIERLCPFPEVASQCRAVIGFKGSQTGFKQFPSRHDDDIESRRNVASTKDLSYQSFSAISLDRPAQLLRSRDAEASHVQVVRQDEERAVLSPDAGSAAVEVLKLAPAANPLMRTKPPGPGHNRPYSLLTVRRLRPFARRLFRTKRPFFELILTRNPWARLRRRVFG
jgi:hypothetical protein